MSDNPCRVYTVRTLEEAKHVLSSAEKGDFKSLALRCFLFLWVAAANCALWVLRLVLFKKWGYKTGEFRSIVVYTVGIVGDNVVMLPALASLRRRYAKAKITVVTNCQAWDQEAARGVLQSSPFKDRLIVLGDDPVQRKGFRFILNGSLTNVSCDLFVNLSPFGNRGWIGAVAREMIFAKMLGASYAIGFRMSTYSRKEIFNKVQCHFVKNEPRRARSVLKLLGLKPIEDEDLFPRDSKAHDTIVRKLREKGTLSESLFVVNPGAKFESKCWPAERFGAVSRWLFEQCDASVVVTGIAGERPLAENVVAAAGNCAINLAGETTIQEMVELLRLSKGCVTNDTGTMHLAAMVGVPTVALFSLRHSPTHWLPLGRHVLSLFSSLDCIYCYNDECKIGACLKGITTDDVIRALREVLGEASGETSRDLATTKVSARVPYAG